MRLGLKLAAASIVTVAAATVSQPPALVDLPWLQYDPAAPLDRGRGVVAFAHEATIEGVVDSIPILASRDRAAPVRAYFRQRYQQDKSPYTLEGGSGLSANLVEFEYEIVGLPVDRVEPHAQWIRVVYAFDRERRPQFGWVAPDPQITRLVPWADFLLTRNLFLLEGSPWAFSDRPSGVPVPVQTPPSALDYTLYPQEARGRWLRVKVVVPSDACQDVQPGTETAIGWVRYLDADGRPLVWFYPRGC